MTVASAPVVQTIDGTVGTSIKVELSELDPASDWSLLTVDVDQAVTYSRRTNSLYFKASVAGEYQIIISYDGAEVKSIKLHVTN